MIQSPSSCCGRNRALAAAGVARPVTAPPPREAARVEAAASPPVRFEYIGPTAMTIHGPLSGLRYRFGRTGEIVAIDARDASSLAAVPNLRRLR